MVPLKEIKVLLDKDFYKSEIKEYKIERQTIEQLSVEIVFSDDLEIPNLTMILMYLTGVEKELNNSSILQFYMEIILNNVNHIETIELVNQLNKNIPLGHFGFEKGNNTLFIKYCGLVGPEYPSNFNINLLNTINSMNYLFKSNLRSFL
jgi:hypothetical protein